MDRDEVIKEFEHLLNTAKGNYQDFVDLTVDGGEEILALLKEQEAVKPEKFMDGQVQRYKCRKCGKRLLYASFAKDNYCSKCGQAVKWDFTR